MSQPETIEASQTPSTQKAVVCSQNALVRLLITERKQIQLLRACKNNCCENRRWKKKAQAFLLWMEFRGGDMFQEYEIFAKWLNEKDSIPNPSLQGTGHLVDRTLQGVVQSPNSGGDK